MENFMLGSIQQSILAVNAFQAANGNGWVLMDGRNIEDSDLYQLQLYPEKNLPDARGVFLRGMNEGRDKETGDTDGNRAAGSPQKDQFAEHNHPVSYFNGDFAFSAGGMGIQNNDGHEVQYGKLSISIGNAGSGTETRPRNIAVYTYIKINN